MHKYQPRIHIVKKPEGASPQVTDLDNEEFKTFIFPESVFTAVTAYQNQLVSIKFTKQMRLEIRNLNSQILSRYQSINPGKV